MPRLSTAWKDIEESRGTGFADVEPGAYVLTITRMEPVESRQYVRLYWDVAEGPSAGAYARSQWPPSDVISWKDAALGILKHKMHVLADSNEGFQPTVAFDNDRWGEFVGRRFGAVVRRRLYTAGPNSKSPGADRTSMEIAAWITPQQVAARDFSESLLADNDQRDRSSAQPAPVVAPTQTIDLYAEDVPF